MKKRQKSIAPSVLLEKARLEARAEALSTIRHFAALRAQPGKEYIFRHGLTALLSQFQHARGQWVTTCPMDRHSHLHPRNNFAAVHVAIKQERRAI